MQRRIAAAKMVVFDQLIFCPFAYLPTFFVMREFVGLATAPSVNAQPRYDKAYRKSSAH